MTKKRYLSISRLLLTSVIALGTTQVEATTQSFVLYTTSAKNIRVVPLVPGSMPNLDVGVNLVASAPCEDDLTQPASIVPLSGGEFIAIWWNLTNSCYSHFTPDGEGGFKEIYSGAWLGKGSPYPIYNSADLNNDHINDLVLIHQTGQPDNFSFQYQVAFGKVDGSFDLTGSLSPPFITPPARGAHFNLVDVDGDKCVDLAFHSFPHGGNYTTTIYMLKGQCNGSFSATKQQLLSHGQGSTTLVFGDFKVDTYLDVFLPPDDDVNDLGQAYIAFGTAPGTFTEVQSSIDFEPTHEGWTGDEFTAVANTCDINLDGYLDIISNEIWSNVSQTTKVYLGNGQGQFSEPGIILFSTPFGKPHPTLTCLSIQSCLGLRCTIIGNTSGTAGDDVICGTEGDDVIWAKGGHDTVCGGKGNDILMGENGNDRLDGGPGNDILNGGEGWDMLDGGEGNDILLGKGSNDMLFGGIGYDYLEGSTGSDLLDGGPDNDICENQLPFIHCENVGTLSLYAGPVPLELQTLIGLQ